jgi:hypothetical protein
MSSVNVYLVFLKVKSKLRSFQKSYQCARECTPERIIVKIVTLPLRSRSKTMNFLMTTVSEDAAPAAPPIKLDAVKALTAISTPPASPYCSSMKGPDQDLNLPAMPTLMEHRRRTRSVSVGSVQDASPPSIRRHRTRALSSARLDDVWALNTDAPTPDCHQILPGSAEARFSTCTTSPKWRPVAHTFGGKAA